MSEVLWLSPDDNFTASAQAIILYDEFETHTLKLQPPPTWPNELTDLLNKVIQLDTAGSLMKNH